MNAVGERPGSGPEWRKLDPQVRKMWFVTAFTYPLIGALILGLPGFFIVREVAEDRKNLAWMGQYAWAAPVLVYVVPVLVSLLTLGLRYGAWRYRVTDNDVATRHGGDLSAPIVCGAEPDSARRCERRAGGAAFWFDGADGAYGGRARAFGTGLD